MKFVGSQHLVTTIEIFSDVGEEGKIYEGQTSTGGSSGGFAWEGTPPGPT